MGKLHPPGIKNKVETFGRLRHRFRFIFFETCALRGACPQRASDSSLASRSKKLTGVSVRVLQYPSKSQSLLAQVERNSRTYGMPWRLAVGPLGE